MSATATPYVTLNHNGVRVYDGVPMCCHQCLNLDSDYNEWTGEDWYGCMENVFLPVKRGVCKKQRPSYPPYEQFRVTAVWVGE